MAEEMGSSTGPYPTEAAAESHSELGGPSPQPSGDEAKSATTAGPEVQTEGHSELETSSPTPSGGEDQSATAAGPTTATSVGSSPGPTAGGLGGAGLGQGEVAGSGATVLPSVPANPSKSAVDAEDPEEGAAFHETSPSRTGALPTVAATPDPLTYKPGGTS